MKRLKNYKNEIMILCLVLGGLFGLLGSFDYYARPPIRPLADPLCHSQWGHQGLHVLPQSHHF